MSLWGMRGTGDWATDQRPKNYRESILLLYPNGSAPLTAIMSKLGSQKVDDPEFAWWTKTIPTQGGAVTGVYTNIGLSSAYASGATAGTTLYVKVAEALAAHFREGHQVLLRDASDLTVDVNAKVTAVVKNGASSYLACQLLEDDDNSTAGDLSDCDQVMVVGNINPEGSELPDAIAYDPVKYYNYTQIFRTPLEITRTAQRTRLRTGDAYAEAKRECLELHSIEMEWAFLFGVRSENTGANGKPERTTDGIISAIRRNVSANIFDFKSDYSGQTWLAKGEDWLDDNFEVLFRYGKDKLILAGSQALQGINKLAKAGGQINLQPETVAYGLQVNKWITPFGTVRIMTHPLLSLYSHTRTMMAVIEPSRLKFRFIDDTFFQKDMGQNNGGRTTIDAKVEGFLTEGGLEYHHPETMGVFYNVGQDAT